jgi:FliI/YscN family ATPase
MDSLTRFATAQREIALAAGEMPAARGFPPSVFASLPKLLERAGCHRDGSITAFYTVLVEGDDLNEPVSDAARSLLDGHIILSRELATAGHFPAVDVLSSVSRLAHDVTQSDHLDAVHDVQRLLAAYRDHADLISIGAYKAGSNPAVDTALAMQRGINDFLQQRLEEACPLETIRAGLMELCRQIPPRNRSG